MATIGTFTRSGDEFHGEIITLSVQSKAARLVPIPGSGDAKSLEYKVFVGRVEIGLARPIRDPEGAGYWDVTLDDPSFSAPIRAGLYADEDEKTFNLVWVRGTGR
jgi:uncharacterized protein (DUF736 family)